MDCCRIYSEDVSNNQSEVKRKLDMGSDSEESLLSTAITEMSLKPIQVPGTKSVFIRSFLDLFTVFFILFWRRGRV